MTIKTDIDSNEDNMIQNVRCDAQNKPAICSCYLTRDPTKDYYPETFISDNFNKDSYWRSFETLRDVDQGSCFLTLSEMRGDMKIAAICADRLVCYPFP